MFLSNCLMRKFIFGLLTIMLALIMAPNRDTHAAETYQFFCTQKTFRFGTNHASDCWGWTSPSGVEYAMMGTLNSIVFINTETMTLVGQVSMPSDGCGWASWMDIKTYQHYAYFVSECTGTNEGLTVVDLQFLPDSIHYVGSFEVNDIGGVTCHNLSIDTASGYAYLEGDIGFFDDNSIYMISLADPENPVYVGGFGPDQGIHDLHVMNDTAYVAGGGGYQLWDVTNKFDPFYPSLISSIIPPDNGFLHNIWPSADGKIFATTEETRAKTVKFWNKEDPLNIQLVGEYLGPAELAHNVHIEGDRAYISHYESGVIVLDISDPSNPLELYINDTYPSGEGYGYEGCWGVYPHTPSGMFYASNMDGYFFLMTEETFTPADTLSADIVIATTGSTVRVDISAVNTRTVSQFRIPLAWSGTFEMTLDSASVVGLRTQELDRVLRKGYNPTAKKAAYTLSSSDDSGNFDIPPGTGPILSLYFSIPYGESGTGNRIRFEPYYAINDYEPEFITPCVTYPVDTVSGLVSLGEPCCSGFRGNIDGDPADEITITDLTYFVAYLFSGGPAPVCIEESNVDGSEDQLPNVVDLTYFVSYLFRNGSPPPDCFQ